MNKFTKDFINILIYVAGLVVVGFMLGIGVKHDSANKVMQRESEIVYSILNELQYTDSWYLIEKFDNQIDMQPIICFHENPQEDCITINDLVKYIKEQIDGT